MLTEKAAVGYKMPVMEARQRQRTGIERKGMPSWFAGQLFQRNFQAMQLRNGVLMPQETTIG